MGRSIPVPFLCCSGLKGNSRTKHAPNLEGILVLGTKWEAVRMGWTLKISQWVQSTTKRI